jgi:hypothetical protein
VEMRCGSSSILVVEEVRNLEQKYSPLFLQCMGHSSDSPFSSGIVLPSFFFFSVGGTGV